MLMLPKLLTADEVAQARALLQNAPWAPGHVTAGPQAAQAKHNEQLPADAPASRGVAQIVLAALERSPHFLAAALPRRIFPPRVNRYSSAAGHFGAHVDGAIRYAQAGLAVRSDLSCTVFLSEPASYDGGELVIHEIAGSRPSVKLAAGDAVLYPGSHVHEVLPVTRGVRLASFFWVESMVRSGEQRQLLHALDMALTNLRSLHGDSEATVALTGTYHNLLRMWAQT